MGSLALDRPAVEAGAVRPAARRRHACPVRRRRGARRAVDDQTAAVFLEPIMGEGGVVDAARGLPGGGPRDHRGARRAAGARRGADRNGPHRSVFRPSARRHHARRRHPGQGTRRRAADRCLHRDRRGGRAADSRPAWQHLRRQSRSARPRHSRYCRCWPTTTLSAMPTFSARRCTTASSRWVIRWSTTSAVAGCCSASSSPPMSPSRSRSRPGTPGSSSTPPRPNVIRLAPPLILTDAQVDDFLGALPGVLDTGPRSRHQ